MDQRLLRFSSGRGPVFQRMAGMPLSCLHSSSSAHTSLSPPPVSFSSSWFIWFLLVFCLVFFYTINLIQVISTFCYLKKTNSFSLLFILLGPAVLEHYSKCKLYLTGLLFKNKKKNPQIKSITCKKTTNKQKARIQRGVFKLFVLFFDESH